MNTTPNQPRLTNTERLSLPRLGTNPRTPITRTEFAAIIGLSAVSAGGILNSLVDKGYAARTPAKRNTRFWRIRNTDAQTVVICPSATVDDLIASLQAKAARADELERVLHSILNILADTGITSFSTENQQ